MFKEKEKKKHLCRVAECALTYLFLSRDRCVGVALGRAEFTAAAAAAWQIRLGGGSGSTSVTAVTCLVRVF